MIAYGSDGPSGRMLDILPIFALPPKPILSQLIVVEYYF